MALCYCYVPYILLCMYISSLFTTCPTICCHGPLQSPFVAIGGSVSSPDCAIVISHLNTDALQGVYEQQLVSGIMIGQAATQYVYGICSICVSYHFVYTYSFLIIDTVDVCPHAFMPWPGWRLWTNACKPAGAVTMSTRVAIRKKKNRFPLKSHQGFLIFSICARIL